MSCADRAEFWGRNSEGWQRNSKGLGAVEVVGVMRAVGAVGMVGVVGVVRAVGVVRVVGAMGGDENKRVSLWGTHSFYNNEKSLNFF